MEIFSGIGIGLLVGVLIGMSTSEVVGTVIAALTALLAAYFGLTGAGTGGAGAGELKRMAAFGIAALVGVIGGLYARTHEVFGRSVAQHVSEWQEAGYDSAAAQRLVVYERTGLITPDWGAAEAGEPSRGQSPYLFSEAVEKCDQIVPDNYPATVELANAYVQAGEGWEDVVGSTDGLDMQRKRRVLESTWRLVCAGQ